MSLPRWNPVGEVISFQDEMDPVFEQELEQALDGWPEPEGADLPIQITEKNDYLVVSIELSGVNSDGVKTSLSEQRLKIKGEYLANPERAPDGPGSYEQSPQKFVRIIELPASGETSIVESCLENDILRVSILKSCD